MCICLFLPLVCPSLLPLAVQLNLGLGSRSQSWSQLVVLLHSFHLFFHLVYYKPVLWKLSVKRNCGPCKRTHTTEGLIFGIIYLKGNLPLGSLPSAHTYHKGAGSFPSLISLALFRRCCSSKSPCKRGRGAPIYQINGSFGQYAEEIMEFPRANKILSHSCRRCPLQEYTESEFRARTSRSAFSMALSTSCCRFIQCRKSM